MSRYVPSACALLIVAIAVWEIVATRAAGAPDDQAWRTAAQLVRAEHRAGDLITFAPAWADPVGRMHLGDLIPIDMAARMDDAKYERIWELSIRGAGRAASPTFEREIDGVVVRRFDRNPPRVLADIRDHVPRGAALVLAEVGFEPRRCLQVTPPPGSPVRMTMTLPAGTLVGYGGLADVFTRRDIRAPATLDVEVAGQVVASISPGVDDGWVRFETQIPAAEVTFVARAAAPNRLLCFAAEVRP
ncbi:MAG TPA: hypothetical protein VK427_21465 [Kofleriaceae bacterium]|nr:hypothetical protein [Kofleriaceae bacterium]